MKLDIISGDAPDIICADNAFMGDIIHLDMLTDMYGLMEEYGGISPDKLLPNVREGLDVDGKMPAITNGFTIRTCTSRYEGISENWNVEQFSEMCRELPADIEKLLNTSGENMRRQAFSVGTARLYRDCVDMDNMTCNFEKSGLKELASAANTLSVSEYDSEQFESN